MCPLQSGVVCGGSYWGACIVYCGVMYTTGDWGGQVGQRRRHILFRVVYFAVPRHT